jgi:hypothetical protein
MRIECQSELSCNLSTKKGEYFISAHSVAETYSVLTKRKNNKKGGSSAKRGKVA